MPKTNQIEAAEFVIGQIVPIIDTREIVPRGASVQDRVILALISKALRVSEGILVLVRAGFGAEAFGLSRTVVEIALTVRYICNDAGVDRADRFTDYIAKDTAVWHEIFEKFYPQNRVLVNPPDPEILERARAFKNPHSWSGVTLRCIATEDDLFEVDSEGNPVRWEFDYEAVYKWASHYVHGTALSIGGHAGDWGHVYHVRRGDPSEDERLGQTTLVNIVIYLSKICVCAFRDLGIRNELINSVFERGIARLLSETP